MTADRDTPLDGLLVVDVGFGHAAGLISKFLAEAGAHVIRLEPPGGDPFYEVYPAYAAWRATLAEVGILTRERFAELMPRVDILLSGGELVGGASIGELIDETAFTGRLIRLEIAPSLPGSPLKAHSGADLLIQAETGIIFETVVDRPVPMAISPSAYGSVFQGLTGLCAALLMRERNGRGQRVSVGLAEAAITMMAPLWSRAETEPPWFHRNVPKGARPLIFRCRDGDLIHVILGSAGAKYKLYQLLGIDDPAVLPDDAGLPNPADPPEKFFGDVDLLAPRAARWQAAELLDALSKAGIVAGKVLAPAEIWDEPQLIHNGIIGATADGLRYVGQPVRWTEAAREAEARAAVDVAERLPLSGLRVVDFGAFVAGPCASAGLADLGAEVIKVEPIGGDVLRPSYPYFAAANRGKKSIALDLKTPEGLRIAGELARSADVVCSNFKVGVAERLGIDPATLHSADPAAVVLLNSGYGLTGPLAAAPAFDPVMQALCGLEVRAGGKGNPPLLNRAVLADFSGGYLGQIGVLMALFHRARRGRGMAVEVPLLNAALFLVADVVKSAAGNVDGPLTLLADRSGFSCTERLYRTRDGWVAIAARTDAEAGALAAALGISSAIGVPRRHWTESHMREAEDFAEASSADALLQILERAGVPAARCREDASAAILASDALAEQGTILDERRGKLGSVRAPGIAYRLSDAAIRPCGSLPSVGQHGPEILAGLGYRPEEIARLQAEKVTLTV